MMEGEGGVLSSVNLVTFFLQRAKRGFPGFTLEVVIALCFAGNEGETATQKAAKEGAGAGGGSGEEVITT